jgi:hypothetical protein
MLHIRPPRLFGLGAAAAAIIAAVAVGSITTGAHAATTVTPGFTDAGRIVLELNRGPISSTSEYTKSSGAVRYFAPGATTPTQSVTFDGGSNCRVANTAAIAALLSFTTVGGNLGLRDAGLGVRTRNNCYRDGGRVDVGQILQFSLDGTSLGSNVRISRAELDIEGKGGADLGYTLDGGTATTADLNASSDNGPDSGSSDNTRVVIEPANPFRTMTLFPSGSSKGQVSLEGGGDFASAADQQANRSILYLVQEGAEVGCGDSVVLTANGAIRTATYTRGSDAVKAGFTCVNINVTLTLDDLGRLLLDTVGTVPDGQELSGTISVDWVIERFDDNMMLKPASVINEELAREVDFDPGAPEVFELVQWCETTTGAIEHPADAPWCLISDTQQLEGDQIIQSQIYVGEEDPMWR